VTSTKKSEDILKRCLNSEISLYSYDVFTFKYSNQRKIKSFYQTQDIFTRFNRFRSIKKNVYTNFLTQQKTIPYKLQKYNTVLCPIVKTKYQVKLLTVIYLPTNCRHICLFIENII